MNTIDEALRPLGIQWPQSTLSYLWNILVTALFAFLVPLSWQRTRSSKKAAWDGMASEICQAVAMAAFEKSVLLLIHNSLLCVRTAAQSGNKRLIAFAYTQLAGQFAWTGNTRIVNNCLKRSDKALPATEDKELLALKAAWDGMAKTNTGEHQKAIEIFENGFQLSLSCGDLYNACSCSVLMGHTNGLVASVARELENSKRFRAIGKEINDRRNTCWAEFQIAHPYARGGNLIPAHEMMLTVIDYVEQEPLVLTESVARSIYAFVMIQSSCYREAFQQAERGWLICDQNRMHLSYLLRNLPLAMEAMAGPNWNQPADDLFDDALASRLCRRSFKFARYPVIRSPIFRTRGRCLVRLGQKPAAIKSFRKALVNARKTRIRNETGRCLLDLAAVTEDQSEATRYREEAVKLFRELGAVIPRAESWSLGDQYDESVVAPEFDLESWEREHGPISPQIDTQES